ncbi:MAG TPA: transcription termination/antitermination NusG family protein [Flavisolibacter sp.]|jgi:transcription antitermination factor NusG|nr:transcription termination/antitermination NusG family protein [Flavisolibacter sp.]
MENWLAVYTKRRCEKKVVNLLAKKNLESYSPLNRIIRVKTNVRDQITVPLFSSWVFVRATEADQDIVLGTEGIVSFLFWRGKPAIIPDTEMSLLQHFVTQHSSISLQKIDATPEETWGKRRNKTLAANNKDTSSPDELYTSISLPSIGYTLTAQVVEGSRPLIRSMT